MLNFRNVSYLDIIRYAKLLDDNYYLSFYNPVYLFIYKDYLKTNIYFHDDNVFFKIYLNDFGFTYFSPLNKDVKSFIEELKLDAKNDGVDPNLGPVSENDLFKYQKEGIELKENSLFNSYIYKIDDFILLKKKYKKQEKLYSKINKDYYFRFVKREDLNIILEFLSVNLDSKDKSYFPTLNMLKVAFEHLYELQIEGYILFDKDNHIKSILLSSFSKKVAFIHKIFYESFDDFLVLMSFFAKKCGNVLKYINIEEESINYLLKEDKVIKPLFIEKYYAKYNL